MELDDFLKNRHRLYVNNISFDHKERYQMRWSLVIVVMGALFVGIFFIIASLAPRDFPTNTAAHIEEGTSLVEIAHYLKDNNYVKSATLFTIIAKVTGSADIMKAGTYAFTERIGVLGAIKRIAAGDYGDVFIRMTIPEGSTNEDVARIAHEAIEGFDSTRFLDAAAAYHGYLFPETYFVLPNISEEELLDTLHTEFSKRLLKIASGQLDNLEEEQLRERVIMASIIEKEARDEHDAYIISGILWKRIEIGMPLQVDATFAYLLGKSSAELTLSDLETDSPYNTYRNRGLPPGPISNPGETALDAAFHPAESPYLYYLHDAKGDVYYGKTHDEHIQNKRLYLR